MKLSGWNKDLKLDQSTASGPFPLSLSLLTTMPIYRLYSEFVSAKRFIEQTDYVALKGETGSVKELGSVKGETGGGGGITEWERVV